MSSAKGTEGFRGNCVASYAQLNWICIRNSGIAKSFDVRVIQGKNVTVYCDTYVRGKRVESKPQYYDVRLTQGKQVRVYNDKYIRVKK